ncbi:MAG: class I SAM-dependent methyltransferase [Candidatus Omnitrophica bacterium]|nr:class I SAM-dependent methyltransferase [Candidatus Omnitrophota bacterium]
MREKFYFDIDVVSKQEFNPWPHSPTYKAYRLIKPNSRVLDIGCAYGYMARELKKKGCEVIGIELDSKACEKAKDYCVHVINADIETLRSLPFSSGFFDYILCLDCLEHLNRPDLVLNNLHLYLSSTGRLIVSVPNIARFEYRLKLLLGNFAFSDTG